MTRYGVQIRMVREAEPGYDTDAKICGPADVLPFVSEIFAGLDREMVVALALDTKHKVNAIHVVSVGHLNGSMVHPREFFKVGILANAAALIIVHNHPSNDTTPSNDDVNIVRRLQKAGEILGIELLDSIIVDADADHSLSMKESGYW